METIGACGTPPPLTRLWPNGRLERNPALGPCVRVEDPVREEPGEEEIGGPLRPAWPWLPLPGALGVPVTGGASRWGWSSLQVLGRALGPRKIGCPPPQQQRAPLELGRDRKPRSRAGGPSPEEAWDWIEERPRLGSGKSKELEKTPRTAAGTRPKEWSLQVRRGRRRLRTGRSTPWRIPRHTYMRVDTTDSEGGRSVRARPRREKPADV
ncbi:hypothetical protein NDU88_007397 [Pleurodeles waltl]|uniref:Uncharacterized protein n=1 Tax=Pleurodeles waltl TaxID=8319 RepID=A0AAV7SSQ4_PLEWA|nr:hypothetical protein NDU88_007397 [Pleurodeles waltl]